MRNNTFKKKNNLLIKQFPYFKKAYIRNCLRIYTKMESMYSEKQTHSLI